MVGGFTVVGLFSHSLTNVFRENVTYKAPTFLFRATKYALLFSAANQLSENNGVTLRGKKPMSENNCKQILETEVVAMQRVSKKAGVGVVRDRSKDGLRGRHLREICNCYSTTVP